MNVYIRTTRTPRVRPAALALALLTAATLAPAFAGNPDTCDLNNNVNNDEQDGGSSTTGLLAFATGFNGRMDNPERRVGELDTRINRGNAMSAARWPA